MKLSGWIFNENICSLINVFNVDIEQNKRFSNVPLDSLIEDFVLCDTCGFVVKHYDKYAWFLDNLFELCCVNLKRAFCDREHIKLDGKNIFKTHFGDFSNINNVSYVENVDCSEEPNDDEIIEQENNAMFTIIENKYVFFNLTTYSFWKPISKHLASTFNTINLCGYLVDMHQHTKIKDFIFSR